MLFLIALCIAVFFGYQAFDRVRTDLTPPVIHLDPQPLEISVNAPKGILLQDIIAEDDVSGDVSGSVVVESIRLLGSDGRFSVGYAAFDEAGNVTKAQREAQFNNYRPPHFTLSAPLLYPFGKTFDVLDDIGAKDFVDGDISHHIRALLTENTPVSASGTHMVQFQVSNSLGDTATEILPVEVYNPEDYTAELTLKEYLIYVPVNGIFNAKFYPDTITYQRETLELGPILPENYTLEISGEVDTKTPGIYPVTYTLTYNETNIWTQKVIKEFVGFSRLIVIVEG